MASRTLPGIGLNGFWTLAEDGWKDGMDSNLLNLSALVQGRALDHVSSTPGSPSNGQVYLFSSTHSTQANKIAVRDNGAWTYITPQSGWEMYDVAAGSMRRFNGSAWMISSQFAHQIALSDMTTALTTGTGKAGWIVPYDCTLVEVFTGLVGAQSTSGSVTVDAKIGATSIFSTNPTIDANEDTSLTGTAAALTTTALTKGQIVKFDITAAGTGSKGLIVTLVTRR